LYEDQQVHLGWNVVHKPLFIYAAAVVLVPTAIRFLLYSFALISLSLSSSIRITGPLIVFLLGFPSRVGDTMASSTTKSGDVELMVTPTQSTNKTDDLALARLGKKAVLKARIFSTVFAYITNGIAAPIWFSIHPRIQLYRFDHLGRISCVSCTTLQYYIDT
jgi:hypothetical protein